MWYGVTVGPKFRRVPRGGPRAWPLWDTRPLWGCVGWDAGTPWAFPGFPVVPARAGLAAAPKMASGLCKPPASGVQVVHRVRESSVPAAQAATHRAERVPTSRAARVDRARSVRRAACSGRAGSVRRPREPRRELRASATRAPCKRRAPSGACTRGPGAAHGPGERASVWRRAASRRLQPPLPSVESRQLASGT